ncbi:hypothetical protein RJ639_004600 [Escallonia herrerae]|uniref:PB1 domain-containing protein n=1 Tax=Escallonia herrerae TaxID=1293975 RepID=A0AA89B015_9ASTE|nr:hypothetical protein RJ639_004600 [Escallonia herrerae]
MAAPTTIKFLCSYGGKILPRYPDGKLRYHGGDTRLLAVDRSISFSELMVKLGELCGSSSVTLRCQLPTEDLDALVSITSDEDLANLIEEYERAASSPSSLKIRAFLALPKKSSPAPSSASSSTSTLSPPRSPSTSTCAAATTTAAASASYKCATPRCFHQIQKPAVYSVCYDKSAGKLPYYVQGSPSRIYLIHNGNHWQ